MPGWRRPVVLVVEDDVELGESLCEALRDQGYSVEIVRDGLAALAWLKTNRRPSLVLLDLWMEGMDGWQFRQAVRDLPDLRGVPIVVVTAADGQTAQMLDVEAVLEKPFTLDRLIATVQQHC